MQTIQTLPRTATSPQNSTCPNALLPGVCRALNLLRNQKLRILCSAGVVWITQEGCIEDVFLADGQFIDLEGPGRVVLSALTEPAIFEFAFPHAEPALTA
ncbi:MAG: hypothetical protein JWO08_1883 [Verrucomicrobiaceae bacterium]|nr:hypothetical protein [Verrucomicrobiaceae bacterium]